jgi:glycine/D-amino acid oxidase-like deaminating enzyme
MIVARVKVVLYRRPKDFSHHRIWGDFISQVYCRPETGGLTLVGSISPDEETGDTVADPDNYTQKVELETIASFAERLAQRYPAMERSHLASSYASLYDVTPDWHHVLDALPGVDGLYLCAGSSGHGFKLAPSVGAMMAQLVLGGKSPEDDINLFAWDRFASDNQVKSQYEYSILA